MEEPRTPHHVLDEDAPGTAAAGGKGGLIVALHLGMAQSESAWRRIFDHHRARIELHHPVAKAKSLDHEIGGWRFETQHGRRILRVGELGATRHQRSRWAENSLRALADVNRVGNLIKAD